MAADISAAVPELDAAVSAIRALLGAAACSCALVSESGDELVFVAAEGAGADAIVGVAIPAGRGIAGWAALSGQPIAVGDVATDSRFARDVAESTEYIPQRILAAPLLSADGEVSGIIEVLDPAAPPGGSSLGQLTGTSAELAVLTTVAAQVAAVVRVTGRLESEGRGAGMTTLVDRCREISGSGPDAVRLAERVLGALADHLRDDA